MTPTSGSSFLRLARKLFGYSIVAWFLWFLWSHREQFRESASLDSADVVVLGVLIVASWTATSAQSYMLFRAANAKIGFFENLVLSIASNCGNYLPMRLGTVMRAHYMKKVHGLDYSSFGSIAAVRLILTLIACGAVGLLSTTLLSLGNQRVISELLLIFGVCISIPVAFFFIRLEKLSLQHSLARFWNRFLHGLELLRRQRHVSLGCLSFVFLQLILLGLRFSYAFGLMSLDVDLWTVGLTVALASVVSFTSITPGALGLREAIMGYAAMAAGESFSNGMLVGSLDRLVMLGLIAMIGSLSLWWIWRRLGRAMEQQI